MIQLRPMREAPRDETAVLLLTNLGWTEARYDPPRYSVDHEGVDSSTGGAWVCCDDTWQVEVVEIYGEDGIVEYDEPECRGWLALADLPAAPEAGR